MADYMEYGHQNRHTLININIVHYMYPCELADKLWQVEVKCTPIVDGIAHFIKKQYGNDKFDHEQFIKDTEEFSNLNSELLEKYDNSPKPFKDAEDFDNSFESILEEKIRTFCNKYGLRIGID